MFEAPKNIEFALASECHPPEYCCSVTWKSASQPV